jgi:hypothetical protein
MRRLLALTLAGIALLVLGSLFVISRFGGKPLRMDAEARGRSEPAWPSTWGYTPAAPPSRAAPAPPPRRVEPEAPPPPPVAEPSPAPAPEAAAETPPPPAPRPWEEVLVVEDAARLGQAAEPLGNALAEARARMAPCLGPAEAPAPGAAAMEEGPVLLLSIENRDGWLVLADAAVAEAGPQGEAAARCALQAVQGLSVPVRFPVNELTGSRFRMRYAVGR